MEAIIIKRDIPSIKQSKNNAKTYRNLIFWIFSLLAVVDLFITFLLFHKEYGLLETNVVFLLTHSFALLVGINILMIVTTTYLLYYRSNALKGLPLYLLIDALIWSSVLRLIAIWNNWKILMYVPPEVIQHSINTTTTAQKATSYATTTAAVYVIPFIVSLLIFIVWRKLHEEA